jgi:hypothetical protein
MMPATTIETTMVTAVEAAKIMPARIAAVMPGLMSMPMMGRAVWSFHNIADGYISRSFVFRAHRLHVSPVGTKMGPGGPNYCEHDNNENDRKNVHTCSIAAATPAATIAATAREPARWLGCRAVA